MATIHQKYHRTDRRTTDDGKSMPRFALRASRSKE